MVSTTFLTEPPPRLCIAGVRSAAASTRAPVLLIHGTRAGRGRTGCVIWPGVDTTCAATRLQGGDRAVCEAISPTTSARRARRVLFTSDTPAHVVCQTHARLTGAAPRLIREMLLTAPAAPLPGTPTLVMTGSRDPLFGSRMQAGLAQRIGADLIEIEDCGHDVPLDGPWPEAADAAVDWLEKLACGGS